MIFTVLSFLRLIYSKDVVGLPTTSLFTAYFLDEELMSVRLNAFLLLR